MTSIFVVAVENSADKLAAELVTALSAQKPGIVMQGVGGAQLASVGIESQIDTDGLSILGFVEGVKALPFVNRKVKEAADAIMNASPDAVVLIDSWGFMIRLAQRLRKVGFSGKIVKYVAPQVWAMRPGRAKVLARHVDYLLSIQPMDAPFFEAAGLPQTYVGNPVFDQDYRSGNGAAFRQQFSISATEAVLGLFPGSRASEVEQLLPALADAVRKLRGDRPDLACVMVLADTVADQVAANWPEDLEILRVAQSEFNDAVAAMDLALAVSGTVTTQIACAGVPTVVIYRLAPLTFAIASRLFQPDNISIVNIAAGRELMPEFMQGDIFGKPVDALRVYLDDENARAAASDALIAQTDRMGAGRGAASKRAATALLEFLGV